MFKRDIIDWEGNVLGEAQLSEDVFSVPVRKDILARVVQWQLAKRRSGNHKTKEIGDISGTTRKPHRQKGTGRARQGSLRSPQFRGGAVIFGPVVRSHAYSLQKKVRQMGLRCALSARLAENRLSVMQAFQIPSGKTKEARSLIKGDSVLMITGEKPCAHLTRAVAALPKINVLSCNGLNVYDILRHKHILVSSEALEHIHRRLGKAHEGVAS